MVLKRAACGLHDGHNEGRVWMRMMGHNMLSDGHKGSMRLWLKLRRVVCGLFDIHNGRMVVGLKSVECG